MKEKDFPISGWWALIGRVGRSKGSRVGRPPLYSLVIFPVIIVLFSILYASALARAQSSSPFLIIFIGFFVLLWIVFTLPGIITNILRRNNFHFSLDEAVFTVQDGILKKEQRQFPYSVIQDVQVAQDFPHRLFGLAEVVVENAASSGLGFGAKPSIGISDNQVIIPALRKQDAENLKAAFLQKMQQNRSVDTGAGL